MTGRREVDERDGETGLIGECSREAKLNQVGTEVMRYEDCRVHCVRYIDIIKGEPQPELPHLLTPSSQCLGALPS